MSTTDTRAAFEEWAESGNGSYTDAWAAWQAATEAANKQAAEPIGWIIGDYPTRRRADFEQDGMVMYAQRCGAATTPVYTAAKATGTAGELKELAKRIRDELDTYDSNPEYRLGYWAATADAAALTGQAEAARQPAPALPLGLRSIDRDADKRIAFIFYDKQDADRFNADMRASLAANRSQP